MRAVIKHPEIDKKDIVEFIGEEYEVVEVWNHGYQQWWFDLRALKPIIEGVNFYDEPLSVPDRAVKLIKKALI